jgi:hypothetical protein
MTDVIPSTPAAAPAAQPSEPKVEAPKTRYEERVEASREERKKIVEAAAPKKDETKKDAKDEKEYKPRALRELEEELEREASEGKAGKEEEAEDGADSESETESESEAEDEKDKKEDKDDKSKKKDDEDDERKLHKLKVDGEEKEVTYDKLKELAQKGFAADKRFQEAAAREKQVTKFFEALKDDPIRVLSHPSLGLNLEEIGEKVLWQKIAPQVMDKDEWQREQDRQELERLRKKEAKEKAARDAAKQKAEAEKRDAEKAERVAKWQETIDSALKDSKVPVSAWSRARMAAHLKEQIAAGNKEITAQELAKKVKQEWADEQRNSFAQLDDDELEDFLGRDIGERLRKRDLEKFKKDEKKEARREKRAARREASEPTYRSVSELMRSLK